MKTANIVSAIMGIFIVVSAAEETVFKFHKIAKATIPGKWKLEESPVQDYGDRKLYPAALKPEGMDDSEIPEEVGMMMMAFELAKVLHEKTFSKQMPVLASTPIVNKVKREGGKAEKMMIIPKPKLGKDVVVFTQVLTLNDGKTVTMNGLVIKSEKRFYLFQSVYSKAKELIFWEAIASKLQEL